MRNRRIFLVYNLCKKDSRFPTQEESGDLMLASISGQVTKGDHMEPFLQRYVSISQLLACESSSASMRCRTSRSACSNDC